MRLATWNCRGMGNGPAVRGLLDFQKQEDPDVLFLCETKMVESNLQKFKSLLGMHGMEVRYCEGKINGLVMFLKKEVNVKLCSFSKFHIDVQIEEEDGFKWRFIGIYGEPTTEKGDITWRLMRIVSKKNKLPWLCIGDFNEILFNREKRKEVHPVRNTKWKNSDGLLKTADWEIWDTGETNSHGETPAGI
jgi:exonuclease III